ncbi:PREDICTED: E3 ubiquitin-protein ligase RDUF1-like [Tarenaya hassleriana]|uniref:E3 ubiquitin-protein ligase RDUF1-like n=1 Tax=Tarenaya hassleriana TaxID=28532 RepID=UPI00053C6720|nr:PREDICTED: E3 ubiquitin-protein ligase RDUF1-like [Tarenaya hassleriana]
MDSIRSSYWCYRCDRFIRIRVREQDSILCPDCGGGFVEETETPLDHGFPSTVVNDSSPGLASPGPSPSPRFQRARRIGADRSPFNPVIVLRGPPTDSGVGNNGTSGGYELYYDDGTGSSLRSLPASMSEFLMGSGFERLLDQLIQLEVNGVERLEQAPASKVAIESMPVIKIVESHVSEETCCAVCKEPFEVDTEAREMPCLTIWRLPGGGFAVGRFNGGMRGGEREFPVVFTEMDGGFNAPGAPRRFFFEPIEGRSRERGRLRRAFRGFISFFGRLRRGSSSSAAS